MDTQITEEIFQKAAQIMNEMIPEEWEKIYLYAQISEDHGTVFFYYFPVGGNKPVYSLNVPKSFNLDEDEFINLRTELDDCFFELWEEIRGSDQEQWTCLTFILENTGNFKIEYGYEDLTENDPIETQVIWEYKTLGIIPENGSYKKSLFDIYMKNLENGEEKR
ncbi:DUF600 family protein [Peribacillus cavernae]|uniref:DUF600 family protein n=1 Tax=Peribacillus cavernae TaxID=1674310 RepID=A0A3S0UJ46_9BACI|nr:antitoxin YezG family protein [Peribacillus cavernae]MDQ0218079.1 uncharacterized protein (TIGR01741 family) [Peribacillus cavernae]RUQ32761.1 DUF600 family protein [Peribacillus cavernae]